jgi:prepilin-type N-terminal cleavage/methylation domain-containing protein
MSSEVSRSRGYSLTEILVVVAIVGILSLISVPAFLNYQKSATFKAALRTYTQDLRNARALAISNSYDVRMEFDTGTTKKSYQTFASRGGNVWFDVSLTGPKSGNTRTLEGPVYIESTNFTDCACLPGNATNAFPDIIFHPNGTVTLPGAVTTGRVNLRTDADIFHNRWVIEFAPSGQIRTRGEKV